MPLGRGQGVPMALGREPKKAGPWAQKMPPRRASHNCLVLD
jgi:hypothetical protein